ncbi:hypothetical protein ANN_25434 [Periplaneta americana]|uniref:Uncharacterized protein n=1 Tax=Periplaneta americana TaxID=6978 RepID=A0ABQ8S1A4_PERAM|nr:hypothetical protein ANN_25434 [Periplaneta americana]
MESNPVIVKAMQLDHLGLSIFVRIVGPDVPEQQVKSEEVRRHAEPRASNERIALTPVMRLLFEISNLRTATPATVSRAGILYINPQDLGWNPYVTSWLEKRANTTEKSNLVMLFDKYIPSCLENMRVRFKKITPITDMAHIQMLCHLLHCLLIPANTPPGEPVDANCPKEWYEIYFVFASVWAFGAAMFQDQSKQASRSSTRVCVRICVSIRRPEFECSGPQLEGPEFECSGPQLEGPEFEYSELSLKQSAAIQVFSDRGPPRGIHQVVGQRVQDGQVSSQGTVFDYYVDTETKQFLSWTERLPVFTLDPDMPLQAALVHTSESIRIRFFLDLLMEQRHPVMLVGNAGVGKTVLVCDKLASLSENYAIANVPFNFYTSSEMLQKILEKPLEKKAGRNYGPPGNKTLVYFIDDMNMPEVDMYGTVQPHTLIRQHLDYSHWYDRNKLTLKDIHKCQYVACMNPTAGSFTINPRLQRHFCVFAVSFPGAEGVNTIYHSIISQHMSNPEYRFPPSVTKLASNVVAASLALHVKVTQVFLPTAIKFHYIFNLRDFSNIFQGLLFSTNECLPQPTDLVRLWMHESQRVYGDKLTDEKDIEAYHKIQNDIVKKNFEFLPSIFVAFLVNADDVNMLGENPQMIRENTEILLEASKAVGLKVNLEKTKYMIIFRNQNILGNGNIKIGDLSLEEVEKFKYLGATGATVTNINDTREEIKRRINMGNACYYSVEKILPSSLLSKNVKVRIYKTVILPVVLYGCETWTLALREEHRLRVFENKILRKIFGDKRDGEWRKLHNTELHALYSSPDIIRNIKSRRLRWAEHEASMSESRNAYRMLVGKPERKRPLGVRDELDESALAEKPNLYCHFAQGIGEPKYMKVKSWESLAALLQDALASYNDLVAAINLVLFEDAMMHVCRDYISVADVPEFCTVAVLSHASKSTDMSLSHLNTLKCHRPGPGSNPQPRG